MLAPAFAYATMKTRLQFTSSILAVLALMAGVAEEGTAQKSGGKITVGSAVRVSAALPNMEQGEMLAMINPHKPQRMIACATVLDTRINNFAVAVYRSMDGGRNWSLAKLDTMSNAMVGDPACGFAGGDTVYYITDYVDEGLKCISRIIVYTSTDAGKTWKLTDQRSPFEHRPYMNIDDTQGPGRGNVYVYFRSRVAHGGKPVVSGEFLKDECVIPSPPPDWGLYGAELIRLVDGKMQPSVFAPTNPGTKQAAPSQGIITEDGSLVIPIEYNKDTAVHKDSAAYVGVVISNDGGASLSAPIVVTDVKECRDKGSAINTQGIAVDRSKSPFRGRIYMGFDDARSGRCLAMISWSEDGGRTWSTPQPLNDDAPEGSGPHQFQAMVGVNSRGVVGVTWYDTRGSQSGQSQHLRFSASLDGGQTWLRSVRVSEAADFSRERPAILSWVMQTKSAMGTAANPTIIESNGSADQVNFKAPPGDTRSMLVNGETFLPFWSDNRTGVLQLYTAPINVAGSAVLHGSTELTKLRDITGPVWLRFQKSRFDEATGTMTYEGVIENRSDSTFRGPLKLRLLSAISPYGTPVASNASSGGSDAGAVWNVPLAKGDTLKPWSSSKPFSVTFRLQGYNRAKVRSVHSPPRTSWLVARFSVLAARP
jgi:hypothetical protein